MTKLCIDIPRYAEIDRAVRHGTLIAVFNAQTTSVKIHSELDTPANREAVARGYLLYDVLFGQYQITENGKDLLKQYAGRDHIGSTIAYIKRLQRTEIHPRCRYWLGVVYFANYPDKYRYTNAELAKLNRMPDELGKYLDIIGVPRYLIDLTRKDINFLRSYQFEEFDNKFWHSYQQSDLGRFDRHMVMDYVAGCNEANRKGTTL